MKRSDPSAKHVLSAEDFHAALDRSGDGATVSAVRGLRGTNGVRLVAEFDDPHEPANDWDPWS